MGVEPAEREFRTTSPHVSATKEEERTTTTKKMKLKVEWLVKNDHTVVIVVRLIWSMTLCVCCVMSEHKWKELLATQKDPTNYS